MTRTRLEMANKSAKRETEDEVRRGVKCYEGHPNINMVIPWIYEIANTMSSRDSD